MYGQQQQNTALAEGIRLAQLDPASRGAAMTYAGAKGFAGALGGAMGIEDPQLKLISARNSIFQQIDQSNPESMMQGIKMLSQMGDNQGAMALAEYYRKAQSEMAQTQQRLSASKASEAQATRERMTPQQQNAMAYASTVAEPGTPQFNSLYQRTLQDLINKEKPDLTSTEQKNAKALALTAGPEGSAPYIEKFNAEMLRLTTKAEGRPVIKEVGVAANTREPVYTYQEGNNPPQQIIYRNVDGKQQMIPYTGGVDRTTATSKTEVKLPEGESEFVKELGKLDAKAVSKASESRGIAIDQLVTLKKMAEVADRPVISGSLAEQRTDVSNFFNTIGLSSNKDRITTANSQEYIKYSTGLVLDNLRKTGYNPSNADMKVVQSIIPRLETDPMARRELIQFMSERANDVITETTQLDAYARKNRGLSGYTPKIPQVNFNAAPSSTGRFPELSDAQIAERIRVLKQEQAK
jgi:hypothetical protein